MTVKVLDKCLPTPYLHSFDKGLLPSLPLPDLAGTIERVRG